MAAYAITTFTGLIETKTIAIKFETLGFFTVTKYLFVWIYLLLDVKAFTCFSRLCSISHLFFSWTLRRL